MAVKGAAAKSEVAQKILQAFPGSFLYNDGKEIRINTSEDGAPIQIKVALTCAKVAVEGGDDITLPGEKNVVIAPTTSVDTIPNEKVPQEPTTEEKERLTTLLNRLGL